MVDNKPVTPQDWVIWGAARRDSAELERHLHSKSTRSPVLLESADSSRTLAVLAEPIQCAKCQRMAFLVVIQKDGVACVSCS